MKTGLQVRSLIKPSAELELSLVREAWPTPKANEVVVRVEAAPVNPSDLGLLLSAADMKNAKVSGDGESTVLTAPVSAGAMKVLAKRVGQSMPVGNEGAGVVIETGSSPEAKALMGKTVAVLAGGGMYSQYRCVRAEQCLALAEGTKSADGASAFVNPLTVMGMIETMRREGHTALVHNAAASSLGQMLVRRCKSEGIELVNIVRKPEQVALLKELGAKHVVNSTAPTFAADLVEAIAQTGATLAFDAAGGGPIAGQILTAMEAVLSGASTAYNAYGSSTHKQVYIYGGLDGSPTEIKRNFGMSWGVGGWLLFPFLQKVGAETTLKMKQAVAASLTTTFATQYSKEISLVEMLQLNEIAGYAQRSTGGKYLIVPHKA